MAETVSQMVVDQAGGLHMGIKRGAAQEFEAPLLQVLGQLVRDLRVVSLTEELANARDVLEAAGITTEVNVAPDVDSAATIEVNRILGFAVREATTNILRHANAAHVQIPLHTGAGLHLGIRNDGVDQRAADTQGTGLDGLRTRLKTAGGNLTTVQEHDTFHLRATLPHTNREEPA